MELVHTRTFAEFFTMATRFREEAAEKIASAEALETEAKRLLLQVTTPPEYGVVGVKYPAMGAGGGAASCCGSCAHMVDEDANGEAMCKKYDCVTKCGFRCLAWEKREAIR
jgi:hypothetical protein